MEQIRTVILGACMLSIAVALCNMIRPSRIFERQVRFLISLLLVISITTPFLQIDYADALEALTETAEPPETAVLEETLEAQLLEETALCSEAAVRSLLSQAGIACTEADVIVHIGDTGSIYISEVSVTCSDFRGASEILRENLGEEVILHVSEVVE